MKHINHFIAMVTIIVTVATISGFVLFGIWYSGLLFFPTVLFVLSCCFAFKIAFKYLLNVGIVHSNELNDFHSKKAKLKDTLKKLDL